MKQYQAKNIINLAIAGHSGSGKTTLAEAMLYLSGATDRLGKVSDGNTVLDFDAEEIKRGESVAAAAAPVEWKNYKINMIDAPGLFDFEGGVCEAVRAADSVLITVSGKDGVSVGTEKAYKAATKAGLSKIFFVNGLCDESADFYQVFTDLKTTFGPSVCPVVVPYIENGKVACYVNLLAFKAYEYDTKGNFKEVPMPDMGDRLEGLRTAINEAVAETDEELMDKYFSGETFTPMEIITGIHSGVRSGDVCPVFCGDALNTNAIDELLDGLTWLAPCAEEAASEVGATIDGDSVDLSCNEDGAVAALVFKTVVDPFIGKISYVKVVSGKLSNDTPVINMRTGENERLGKITVMRGKKQEEVEYLGAGDIGALPKLADVKTGDTLCSPLRKVTLEGIQYPNAVLSMAILPKNKGDEDKVAQGIIRLMEEDPTIRFESNAETHQMVISGLGEQHLDVVVSKLKSKFNVDVTLAPAKVPYREAIRKKVSVQGRHKKQSGGHGQFGDVFIEFEPCDSEGLEFAERVVGGAVPKNYFPAVEKGLRECIKKGVLAGYPMVGLKATLFDGSYHPVDSSEQAFKMAASVAFKNGIPQASPCLLEPFGNLQVIVPDDNMGDVLGEVNKRRGRVMGMDPGEDVQQVIEAQAPMAEMSDFATFLRQTTRGRGSFTFVFDHYEEAPAMVADKVIAEAKAAAEED